MLHYCECLRNPGFVPKIMCLVCVQSGVSTRTSKLACLCPQAFRKLLIHGSPVSFLSPITLECFQNKL